MYVILSISRYNTRTQKAQTNWSLLFFLCHSWLLYNNKYYFISTTTTTKYYKVHTSPNLRTHEKQTCIEIWNSIRFLLVNSSWHNESLWKLFMSGRPMRNWITKPCNRHLATWSHTLLYKEMANTSAFKVGADWRICNVPFF